MNTVCRVRQPLVVLALLSLLVVGTVDAQTAPAPDTNSNPHEAMHAMGANPHLASGQDGAAAPHGNGFTANDARSQISWTLPTGWSELPPTSMRLGNFLYTHNNGQKVEITIASLPGPAGGPAANFGMWRSQVGLPHLEDIQVLALSKKIKAGDIEMTTIDVVSNDNLIDNKFKARIVGAIYERDGNSWFFKMKGEDSAVGSAKGAFIKFLESIKFNDAKKI